MNGWEVPLWVAEMAPSDWMMVIFTVGQLWFVFDYGIFSPWWRAPIGWVVMAYGLSVLLLMTLILYGLVAGQRVDEWARLPVSVLLVVGILGKIVILHVSRHEGRIEHRKLRAERASDRASRLNQSSPGTKLN